MRTTRAGAAGLVLLAGLVTACGGGGEAGAGGEGAPGDASRQEFCEAYAGLFADFGAIDPDDTGAGIEAFQAWADDMRQVGTPEDIPEDARRGFTVVLDSISEIDPDATEEELAALGEDLSQGDQDSGQAFVEYATETCPDAMKGIPGDGEDQQG